MNRAGQRRKERPKTKNEADEKERGLKKQCLLTCITFIFVRSFNGLEWGKKGVGNCMKSARDPSDVFFFLNASLCEHCGVNLNVIAYQSWFISDRFWSVTMPAPTIPIRFQFSSSLKTTFVHAEHFYYSFNFFRHSSRYFMGGFSRIFLYRGKYSFQTQEDEFFHSIQICFQPTIYSANKKVF